MELLGLAAAESSSFLCAPVFAASTPWATRQRIIESYQHIAPTVTCSEVQYSTTSEIPRARRPKPYHVGPGARLFVWLHPIPSAVSPLLWACEEEQEKRVKVHLWQTLQVLHGDDFPTCFRECPLCQSRMWPSLHEHILLSCAHPPLAESRTAALKSTLQLALQSAEEASRKPRPCRVAVPQSLVAALHRWEAGLYLRTPERKVMLRFLLCGQWPFRWGTAADLQLVSKEEASVLSNPHLTFRNSAGPLLPPSRWKQMVAKAADFSSTAWDECVKRMLKLTSQEFLPVQKHARYLWWAAHGRGSTLPGSSRPLPSAVSKHTARVRARRFERTYFPVRSERRAPRSFSAQSTLFDVGVSRPDIPSSPGSDSE